ncbi:SIMPL domain-containing protein [Phenylobacterium sp.]|uniref:SIMPL domain-containing protein n=1 Tax=Phenylobacterium sp. TaxID=1871053 RepID=UPI002DF1BB16|nr:SIMPL domain-containing protein [Phenylobacterium sp.]HEV2531049.1 SIMPL domain-containing protein [Phenylobacterium sp.]
MKRFLSAAALAFAVVITAAQVAFAQVPSDARFAATTLNLSAYGDVKAAPDMATITLGVQTEAATAALALAANAEQMNRVMAALKRDGIAERDIRTAQLNVNPKYVYEQNQPPRLTGYDASNQVTVTVHDLKRLGQTVDAAVGAGATNVNSVAFGLSDPTAAQDAARLAAVRALQAKAELYARALGHPVVRLVSLSEGASFAPPVITEPVMVAQSRMVQPTPVSPGELQVRIQVSGVYELAR